MEIKKKYRGWKEGVMSRDLVCVGGSMHKKGSIVRYRKYKEMDFDFGWTGEYEYNYVDQANFNLIRCKELLIE